MNQMSLDFFAAILMEATFSIAFDVVYVSAYKVHSILYVSNPNPFIMHWIGWWHMVSYIWMQTLVFLNQMYDFQCSEMAYTALYINCKWDRTSDCLSLSWHVCLLCTWTVAVRLHLCIYRRLWSNLRWFIYLWQSLHGSAGAEIAIV